MDFPNVVKKTDIPGATLLNRGKVRDIYDAGPAHLLIVTSDRISAFDVVMEQGIPAKGIVLTHANLLANIRDISDTSRLTSDDVSLSWMPLTHDMGLI